MAIANTNNATYSISPDVVVPDGNNRFVLILIGGDNAGTGYFDPPDTMDLNGVAGVLYCNGYTAQYVSQIWGFTIPNTMAAGTYTATYTGSNVQRWFSSVFTGVSRDPVVDADINYSITTTGASNAITVDCVDGGWAEDVIFLNIAKTAGAGQAVIENLEGRPGISYKSGLTAGTTTFSWVYTNDRFSHSLISLRPHKSGSGIIMF